MHAAAIEHLRAIFAEIGVRFLEKLNGFGHRNEAGGFAVAQDQYGILRIFHDDLSELQSLGRAM